MQLCILLSLLRDRRLLFPSSSFRDFSFFRLKTQCSGRQATTLATLKTKWEEEEEVSRRLRELSWLRVIQLNSDDLEARYMT